MTPRIYVKEASILSSAGLGTAAFWQQLLSAETRFSVRNDVLVSALSDESNQSLNHIAQDRKWKMHDRVSLMALACARELRTVRADAGCVLGSSRGATITIEREYAKHHAGAKVSAFASPTSTLGSLSSTVADDLHLVGPVCSLSSACATGLLSVGTGFAYLKSGLATSMLTGGSEASLTPFTVAQLRAAKIYHRQNTDQYQPFSERRSGMVLGEGACLIYLDTTKPEQHAVELCSFAATHESAGLTGISSDAEGLRRAVLTAIEQASIDVRDVSFVVAHGAGTEKGDAAEMAAYNEIFRSELPAITSGKWATGHVLGASGAISVALASMMLSKKRFIPLPYEHKIKAPAEPAHYKYALVTALGFGGTAAAAILRV